MSSTPPILRRLSLIMVTFLLQQFFPTSHGDVGTAARYSPPYSPTACYGSDPSQFPSSNLFASAGDGIWDNGASCGRQYLVRCISASQPGTCVQGQTIQIRSLIMLAQHLLCLDLLMAPPWFCPRLLSRPLQMHLSSPLSISNFNRYDMENGQG